MQNPADVKRDFGAGIDFVTNSRAIFNIKGNDYRLIAELNYRKRAVFIRFLGTHSEYDRVNAATVKDH
jgi:mRNA interferase HigB